MIEGKPFRGLQAPPVVVPMFAECTLPRHSGVWCDSHAEVRFGAMRGASLQIPQCSANADLYQMIP